MKFQPGIYFDLPEDDYHAIPALSASGIKRLQGSTMDFWAYSWMNPERDEDDPDSIARLLGKAHHVAVLEPHRFEETYCAELDPGDYPDALRTMDDLRARAEELGLKKGGRKDELEERVLDADPDAVIWGRFLEDYVNGRTVLKPATWRRLAQLRAVCQADAVVQKALSGGYAEVTICWLERGVPCKARLDYWKRKAIGDVKTYGNPDSQNIYRAILRAFARYHYHIQAAWYGKAVAAATSRATTTPLPVFGPDHPEIFEGEAKDMASAFVAEADAEPQFVFIFAQTGPAPVVRSYVFPRSGGWRLAEDICDQAVETFRACQEQFGTKPWVDAAALGQFDDSEFPAYMWD